MKTNVKKVCAVVVLPLLVATAAFAGDDDAIDFSKETLTGDWGGLRSAAAGKGYLWEGALKIDSLSNRGALRNGSRSVSHLDFKLTVDLEKAFGWKGGSALFNIISDAGQGHNHTANTHVGSLMGVTNLEVPVPTTTRLFHAWIQQNLFDDKLSVLAGIYPIDSEFQTLGSAGVFLKPEYGPTAELALTRGPSVFNNAAFGIRTRIQNADQTLYGQWALMDGIPNDPAKPKRTAIRFAKNDGAFNIAEFGWLPEATNDKFIGQAKAAIGFWGYTSKVDDLVDVDAAGNPQRRNSSGGYVLAERTMLRLGGDNERYLTGFARYSWTDGDSSAIRNTTSLGLVLQGPFATRPDDTIGLAWSRAATSAKWRASQLATNPAAVYATNENAWELTYRYAITPWFSIQPNFQRTANPGGRRDLPASRVIGARIELVL